MVVMIAITIFLAVVMSHGTFNKDLDQDWENYKLTYNKLYTEDLHHPRRSSWEKRIEAIRKHNAEADLMQNTYHVGENEYLDLSQDEFRAYMYGFLKPNISDESIYFSSDINMTTLPESVDWREEGYVTAVKNQRYCSSCWAFSATGALEAQMFKKTKKLISLSEQNLVDCAGKQGNHGCNGGLPSLAFKYIKDNDGIDTEESYPYKAKDGKCQFKEGNEGGTDKGFVRVPQDELELQRAVVEIGPIAVGIDADEFSFHVYKSGIYSHPNCSRYDLNHGVLVVGYGSQNGRDYWIIKNSWGESWGQDGYVLLARNEDNMCGVATDAVYPSV